MRRIYGRIVEEDNAEGWPHLGVGICGLQLELRDGLPHPLLDPHAWDLEQGQGVVHGLDGDVEGLRHLHRTLGTRLLRKRGLQVTWKRVERLGRLLQNQELTGQQFSVSCMFQSSESAVK